MNRTYHIPESGQAPVADLVERTATGSVPLPVPDAQGWGNVATIAHNAGLLDAETVARVGIALALSGPDAAADALVGGLKANGAGQRALDAIAPLFGPNDVIELRALCPAGGGALSRCGRLDVPEERAALADFIDTHNGRRNLYFGANPRQTALAGTAAAARAEQIAARRAFFFDLDDKDAPPDDAGWTRTVEALRAEDNPPDMIFRTGNGVHVWWRVQEVRGEALAASVRPLAGLMARFGSDNVADLSRIARLPVTVNLPTASKRKRGAVPAFVTVEQVRQGHTTAGGAVWTLDAAVAALDVLAGRLALPGKPGASTASTGACEDECGGAGRTPRPAPSADLLREALAALPNAPGGAFDDRGEWVALCHAVKGAAVAAGIEGEGLEIWLDWCTQWGGDSGENARVWDTARDPRTGWGTLMRTLEQVSPAGHTIVRAREAAAVFAAAPIDPVQLPILIEGVGTAAAHAVPLRFDPQPARQIAPASIPPRQWIYGTSYIRGHYSVTVAPGGLGKSALTLIEAISMTSGRGLLGEKLPLPRPLRVWMANLEDPQDELDRRLAAALEHHGLTHADLGGRLLLSGRDTPMRLVEVRQGGPVVNEPTVRGLIEALRRKKIDVFILDPLASAHGAPENDNTAMGMVVACLRQIADEANVSVMVIHHTTKAAAQAGNQHGVYGGRGAGALIDGARIARVLIRMTDKEALRFGVGQEDRRALFRAENGKANLGPLEKAVWRRIVSVPLRNGTPDYPAGDRVGVVEKWEPPAQAGGGVSDAEARSIQNALPAALAEQRRADAQAEGWVGYLIADVLGVDVGAHGTRPDDLDPHAAMERARIKSIIATGLKEGWLVKGDERCADGNNRRLRPCIKAGELIEPDADRPQADETDAGETDA